MPELAKNYPDSSDLDLVSYEIREDTKYSLKKLKKESFSNEELKSITNNDFLSISRKKRLQYITNNNIDYSNIAN
jgi:hypothetical protein